MDIAVAAVVLQKVAIPVVPDHRGVGGGDVGDLGIRDALAGEFAGQRFKPLAHLEQVAHVLVGHPGRARAAVRQQLNQALGGEHLEGFAQRRARDLQLFTEVALGNPRARWNLAIEQHGADAAYHFIMKHRRQNPV